MGPLKVYLIPLYYTEQNKVTFLIPFTRRRLLSAYPSLPDICATSFLGALVQDVGIKLWHGKLCTWKGWGSIVRAQNKGILAFLIGLLFSRSPIIKSGKNAYPSRSQWIPKVSSGRNSEISQIPDPENLFGNSRLAIFLLKVSTCSNNAF